MERNNNTIKSRKGKHLTYEERQSIENEGKEFSVRICLRTLYHYIEKGLFLNIGKGDLPQGGKQRKRSEKVRRANNNPTGTSISERAEEIESRNDFGHWELDTVVGKAKTKAALLVLTERKTRYELIYKLENKLIRRFIPKGTDIGKLTRKEIKRIQRWMNDYPIAILDGLSAKMAVLALWQEPADA